MSVKVLYLSTRLATAGGVPRFVRHLSANLDPDKFEAHVCTVRPLVDEDDLDDLGTRVSLHSLDVAPGTRGRGAPRVEARFARLVRRVRPDVVHVHAGTAWGALGAVALRTVPAARVLQIHEGRRAALSRANWSLQRFLVRRARFTPIVDSLSVRDELSAVLGVDPGRVPVLPLGVELPELEGRAERGRQWRARNGVPADSPIVLDVARLTPTKNIPLFLDVAQRVLRGGVEAHFFVAGPGKRRVGELNETVAPDLRDRVRVLGFRDDLDDLVAASDVFLSTSSYEGFGLAIAESMAAALPVVARRVGNLPELVADGETGFVLEPDDTQGLVDAVSRLLRDAELRTRAGHAARRRIGDHFTVPAMVARYESLYLDLVGGARARR